MAEKVELKLPEKFREELEAFNQYEGDFPAEPSEREVHPPLGRSLFGAQDEIKPNLGIILGYQPYQGGIRTEPINGRKCKEKKPSLFESAKNYIVRFFNKSPEDKVTWAEVNKIEKTVEAANNVLPAGGFFLAMTMGTISMLEEDKEAISDKKEIGCEDPKQKGMSSMERSAVVLLSDYAIPMLMDMAMERVHEKVHSKSKENMHKKVSN